MDSTEEIDSKALMADEQEDYTTDNSGGRMELHRETGYNKIFLQMLLEDYAYGITEETVSGMHLPLGKPHQPDQLII